MVSKIKSLIVADMPGHDVPSVPPSKKIKATIGSIESMKSSNIDDAKTIAAKAAAASKLMEHMMAMSLKRSSGNTGQSVRKWFPTSTHYQFGYFSDEGYTMVKPNIYLSTKISMIWATTAMRDKNDRNISSTQLDSHTYMLVVGKQACILHHSRKSANVRPFPNECSKMEKGPLFYSVLVYYCKFITKIYLLIMRNVVYIT